MRPAGGLRAAAAMATVAVLALLDDATVFAQVTSGLGDTETLEVHARPVLETASDLGSHAETLTADDVGDAQAWSMDDLLRREPSFGVFRRASSLVANPTTEGVALRGLGGTAASRALVLLDGVPLNDPFGGWVSFARVPLAAVTRIELLAGGAPRPWSTESLSGVIAIESDAEPSAPTHAATARLDARGGTQGSVAIDLGIADRREWPLPALAVSIARTDGWVTIDADQRGAVDVPAWSEHGFVDGRVELVDRDDARWSVGGSLFDERRGNGTPLTGNDTQLGTLRTRARLAAPGAGAFDVAGYAQWERFASRFSAVDETRDSEALTLDQFSVPASAYGGSVVWSGGWNVATRAGLAARDTDGATHEDFRRVAGELTRRRRAGGALSTVGGFLEQDLALGGLADVELSVGADRFATHDGSRVERDLTSGQVTRDDSFPNRSTWLVTPRIGVESRALDGWRLRVAASRSARTPTLNELYRPFRVGNDVTEANAALDPEVAWGAELGADGDVRVGRLALTGFWVEIRDPIVNVTVGAGPATIDPCGAIPDGGTCRQRQNLGATRVRGLEVGVSDVVLGPASLGAGYQLADSRVLEAEQAPSLVGKQLAQVPRHRGAITLAAGEPALARLTVTGRFEGRQYDDDLNSRVLHAYATLDAGVARVVTESLTLAVEGRNLAGPRAEVGRTASGVVSIGDPLQVWAELRATF